MEDKQYKELLERLEKAEKNAQIARDWVEISNLHGRIITFVWGTTGKKSVMSCLHKRRQG